MKNIRFSILELVFIGPALFPSLSFIISGFSQPVDAFFGLHLLVGQLIGIFYGVAVRKSDVNCSVRESFELIFGGALAGIGMGALIQLVSVLLFSRVWGRFSAMQVW